MILGSLQVHPMAVYRFLIPALQTNPSPHIARMVSKKHSLLTGTLLSAEFYFQADKITKLKPITSKIIVNCLVFQQQTKYVRQIGFQVENTKSHQSLRV
jgi:hypothetical protein